MLFSHEYYLTLMLATFTRCFHRNIQKEPSTRWFTSCSAGEKFNTECSVKCSIVWNRFFTIVPLNHHLKLCWLMWVVFVCIPPLRLVMLTIKHLNHALFMSCGMLRLLAYSVTQCPLLIWVWSSWNSTVIVIWDWILCHQFLYIVCLLLKLRTNSVLSSLYLYSTSDVATSSQCEDHGVIGIVWLVLSVVASTIHGHVYHNIMYCQFLL